MKALILSDEINQFHWTMLKSVLLNFKPASLESGLFASLAKHRRQQPDYGRFLRPEPDELVLALKFLVGATSHYFKTRTRTGLLL